MVSINPWLFITVPSGACIAIVAVAILVAVVRDWFEGITIEQKVNQRLQDRIDQEFYPTNPETVWKMVDRDQQPELYIRVPVKAKK